MTSTLYTDLASEYYDPVAHPTCANFREASLWLIRFLIRVESLGRTCEIGAGRSALLEILSTSAAHPNVESVCLVDSSEAMLLHSEPLLSAGASLVVADSEDLPLAPSVLDFVVISLGDPFNTLRFWQGLGTLRPGARAIFTAPSFDWAHRFRSEEGDPGDVARFTLRNGNVVDTPSIIRDSDTQIRMMGSAGFRTVEVMHFRQNDLRGIVSRKLAGADHIVSGYLVERRP